MTDDDFIYRPFTRYELVDWPGAEVYYKRVADYCLVECLRVYHDRVYLMLKYETRVYMLTPEQFLKDCTHSEGLKCGRPAVDYF